jgi:tetratricopeptide (TPR) repeat protein
MQTLYDLLGALPSDDAEGLRIAFRKAVKGAHPDIHPDDPDAALKFREIVRANEILIDDEQRRTYDHLLQLAHRESSNLAVAARIYRYASGVIALAAVSVVTVGGYLLFTLMSVVSITPVSVASITPAKQIEFAVHRSARIASVHAAIASPEATNESPATSESPSFANPEKPGTSGEAMPVNAVPEPNAEIVPAANAGPAPDPRSLRAQGVFAYHSGDLYGALAALDQAIDLDPKFLDAYIDRGIVLYRLQKFDRAYADISRAKRIEKAVRSKASPLTAEKQRFNPAAIAPSTPPPPWRARVRDNRLERVTSAGP